MKLRIVVIAGLTVLWVLLWGDARPLIWIGGLLVSATVTTVFPFPEAKVEGGTLRPWPFVVLVGRFTFDLVKASFEVAWLVVRPGPLPKPAVIELRLQSDSDLLQVLTVELLSLVPGSLLLELDGPGRRAWLHVLHADTPELVERARAAAHAQEQRVLAAFGTQTPREENNQ